MPAMAMSKTVDADQVTRQPQRQRNEAAEHEKIVEREAPHAEVFQRFEFGQDAARLARA
jgi:hypothetical protein